MSEIEIERTMKMTLVNAKEVLGNAKIGKYAVGAFNATTLEGVLGVIRGAEKSESPVLLQYAEVHKELMDLEVIGPLMVQEAKKAKVPVVVHYDHGKDVNMIKKALEIGFTSVMIDGADLPFEENIALTKGVVEMAKEYGATVEGELGTIGGSEKGDVSEDGTEEPDIYTNPEDAKIFVEKTGVDMLAVAYGTAHGLYKERPKLDFQRLEELAAAVPVPLVMHGGSGLTEEEYKESIAKGICKINYYSDLANRVAIRVYDVLEKCKKEGKDAYGHDISLCATDTITQDVAEKIEFFGSKGKAKGGLQ